MWQICLTTDTGQNRDMWVPMVSCIYLTLCRLCDLLECLFEGLHATETLESLTLGERWVVFWKLNSQQFQVFQVALIPKLVCTKTDTENGIWIFYLGSAIFKKIFICVAFTFLLGFLRGFFLVDLVCLVLGFFLFLICLYVLQKLS